MEQHITPEEWSERYEGGSTPWDLGRAHRELIQRLSAGLQPFGSKRALVPGSGRGHDALALGRAGWKVTALDIAESLREPLAAKLGPVGGEVVIGDAFAYGGGPFDLVFDHTFFCTIDPPDRAEFGGLLNRVTEPGSRLASVVFPIGRPHSEPSPPWGVDVSAMTNALGDGWSLVLDEEAINPPGRRWQARWAEWVRVD